MWETLKSDLAEYTDETLSRESLNDDYQQLFVAMVLDHVAHVFECFHADMQPEPMRLLLLGTAGSGKTRAVQTVLQEIQRALKAADLPADIDPQSFVRVAAPTGSAAFQIRFNATTIHRLIHWFRPPYFAELTNDEALAFLQKHLRKTELIVLDEISMVGRQMMGRIDSRMEQAKVGLNPAEETLGGASCVAVGDPAQCEAMMDQQIYDVVSHKKTTVEGLSLIHI